MQMQRTLILGGIAVSIFGALGLADVFSGVIAQTNLIESEVGARDSFSEKHQAYLFEDPGPNAVSTASEPNSVAQGASLPFPHIATYGGQGGTAKPFVDDNGVIRPEVIRAYANRQLAIIPPTPLVESRIDVVDALRVANPNLLLFAYVMGSTTWCPQDSNGQISYPSNYYYHQYWLAAADQDPNCNSQSNGLLWLQDGQRADGIGINVNLAHRVALPGGGFQYDYAENIAQLMYDFSALPTQTNGQKVFDGIFIDVYCGDIDWMETPTVKFDYARAGFGSDNNDPTNQQAFFDAWNAGFNALGLKLRELVGQNDFPIIGNCGQGPSTLYDSFNGWMRENFPLQNGGTWFSNLYRRPGGYLHEERDYRGPQHNFIFSGASPSTAPYSTHNLRKQRWTLATASLGNGWGLFQDTSADPLTWDFYFWWYDEWAVDLLTGQASTQLGHTGWLGQPTSADYQMIWLDPNDDLPSSISNPDFEIDLAGWKLNASPGNSGILAQDATTGGTATSSAKVTVVTPNELNWLVNLATENTISVSAGQSYAITFWAKGSVDRSVVPVLGNASLIIPITTEWKRYQVVLTPTTSSSSAFRFDLANTAGDVWFDDIHLQTQITNVYRRDFDNGAVILNPHAITLTVQLEEPFRKILGTQAPTVNDGALVSSVTLQGSAGNAGVGDAIFLLATDTIAPSRVNDLSAQ